MKTYGSINGFALGYSQTARQVPKNEYHYHEDYEIMYLRRGSREVFVQSKKYRLTAGCLLFIEKDTIHKTNTISEEYERFVINFTENYIQPTVKQHIAPLFEQAIYAPERISGIDRIFCSIWDEWDRLRKNDDMSSELLKGYVNILLAMFIRNHDAWALDARVSNPAIERLVQYINDNPHEEITLEGSARMLKISPSYLSKTFTKNTGFGFREYLMIVRIKKAKQLLETTDVPVRQIAFDCGFNDSNYFSSAFKKATGFSPLKYRKMF